jgi:hypothetical protein
MAELAAADALLAAAEAADDAELMAAEAADEAELAAPEAAEEAMTVGLVTEPFMLVMAMVPEPVAAEPVAVAVAKKAAQSLEAACWAWMRSLGLQLVVRQPTMRGSSLAWLAWLHWQAWSVRLQPI